MSKTDEPPFARSQIIRETTPSPSIDRNLFIRITPEIKQQRYRSGTSTPLRTIKESNSVVASQKDDDVNNPIPKNPFEVRAEALYFSSCSPSIFATFTRKNEKKEANFRWSIEQLSELYPADIDETSIQDAWMDSENEVQAQKAIDAFFSQKQIVPSPWSSAGSTSSAHRGKVKEKFRRNVQDTDNKHLSQNEISTQTTLSIPPHLDLRSILGEYFTCNDEQQEAISSRENSGIEGDILSASSLRRKLFAATEEEDGLDNSGDESVGVSTPDVAMRGCHTKRTSDPLSSSPITPYHMRSSVGGTPSISSPTVSPIRFTSCSSPPPSVCRMEETRCDEWMQEDTSQSMMSIEVTASSSQQQQWPTSDAQDTGYLTGSTNQSSSCMASASQSSHTAPLTDLMELSVHHQVTMATDSSVLFSLQSSNGWPSWGVPNGCSTPTKTQS